MMATLLGLVLLAPPFAAAPDAYGSKDGRIKAKNPLERRAGKAEREALDRAPSDTVDLRVPVLFGTLPKADLARLPDGVDLAALIAELLRDSKTLRSVYVVDCIESECLNQRAGQELSKHLSELVATEGGVSEDGSIVAVSAEAKARNRLGVISLSLDEDRRLTMILSETPGRGLLGQVVTAPLEAKDIFDASFGKGIGHLLRLGTPDEGLLEPVEDPVAAATQGEPAHVLAYRQNLKAKSKYGIYGGAGAAGLGVVLGLYATVNAYRWRRLSYREPEYREQFRSAVSGQAVFADILMIGGGAVAGAAYWARGHADNIGAFSWLAGDGPPASEGAESTSVTGEVAEEPPAPSPTETNTEPEAAKPKRKLIR